MKYLKQEVIKQIEKRFNDNLKKIELEEGLKSLMGFYGKEYKNNPKEKFIKFLTNKKDIDIKTTTSHINKINQQRPFKQDLIITIEWKKSRMWGSNPKAYTNFGFEGRSIGGCGYCKTSTATAEALNSDYRILKLLYKKKDKWFKENQNKEFTEDIKREYLGYGSGYNVLPVFEGGVGISSHQQIIEKLGLKWKNITNTDQTDVFMVIK